MDLDLPEHAACCTKETKTYTAQRMKLVQRQERIVDGVLALPEHVTCCTKQIKRLTRGAQRRKE
jgi:uncharacterized Fe-S radical SAM superfamily protein PflX